MDIEYSGGWIRHSSGDFFLLDHPVVDARRIGDRIIVLFDYMTFPEDKSARNLFAYTLEGNKLWCADDIGCGPVDAYVNFISESPLIVGNFAGYECSVDISCGKILSSRFTK